MPLTSHDFHPHFSPLQSNRNMAAEKVDFASPENAKERSASDEDTILCRTRSRTTSNAKGYLGLKSLNPRVLALIFEPLLYPFAVLALRILTSTAR